MQNVLLDQIVQLGKVEDSNGGQTFPQVEEIKAAVLHIGLGTAQS